jgi:3-hydroxybutyryl-CoA dehydratase
VSDREILGRDWTELRPGDRFVSTGRTVTESDLVLFSVLTGDWHPAHADADWAAGGPYGERTAHPTLVLAYAFGRIPFVPERMLGVRTLREAVFKRPLRLGESLRVEGSVRELTPVEPSVGAVDWRLRVVDARRRTCVRVDVELLWRIERRTEDRSAEEYWPPGVVPL